MRRLFLTLCVVLQACGGGGGSVIQTAQSGTVTTPLPINTEGMSIIKPATALDGYDGGLKVLRAADALAGGTPGFVNTASFSKTSSGQNELSFEWTSLSVLDNHANGGQNVALYAQSNKYGTGPTFAGVSEVADLSGLAGAVIAHEFDVWIRGADNGQRIGLDVLVGDVASTRLGLPRSAVAEASTAIRIDATMSTTYASWGTGLEINAVRDSAIKVKNAQGSVVFEVKPNGDVYKNGVRVL